MGQISPGCARTTEAMRREIQIVSPFAGILCCPSTIVFMLCRRAFLISGDHLCTGFFNATESVNYQSRTKKRGKRRNSKLPYPSKKNLHTALKSESRELSKAFKTSVRD
jgi:hypothetical protein